jgi:dTDP-4-dehydrorhamnose reductase
MKIIVLGATGMLGYEFFRMCVKRDMDVHAIVRNKEKLVDKFAKYVNRIHTIDDVKNIGALEKIITDVQPDYVINCVGIVKQSHLAEDYYESVSVNALLPHQLEKLGEKYNFCFLHVSTDCVFDGKKGHYKETDLPNAYDLYGKSKHLGEVGYGKGITIRTSIIGHEISEHTHGLVEWFMAQQGKVKGFTKAIFSGVTTLELSHIILDVIIPGKLPPGIYQIASDPISKYDLIKLISKKYNKQIDIEPSEDLVIDRSLDGSNFEKLTGYKVPSWEKQIEAMQEDFNEGFKK